MSVPVPKATVVEVLLATFEGERWLAEQIASILSQEVEGAAVRVLARDDGSRDGTAQLLEVVAGSDAERVRLLRGGETTGSAAGNFAELLRACTGPYVALADQDDVWVADKLSRCMVRMCELEQAWGADVPLLVFTDLTVVDERLQLKAASLWANNRLDPGTVNRLSRLLGENVVTGCTALLNRPMVELARRMPVGLASFEGAGAGAVMHDHWIALLACTLGRSAWIAEPTVMYRQHGANVVGAARVDGSTGGRAKRLLGHEARRHRIRVREQLQRQAELFLGCYQRELSAANRETLMAFSGLDEQKRFARIATVIRRGFWRTGAARNLSTLLDLVLGPSAKSR